MLSSIWVATITGLPAARQARVRRFWIGGSEVTGSSTPRSPRATMMPSEASRISAKAVNAGGLLDLRHDRGAALRQFARLKHVGGALDEAQRQPVDAELAGELQILRSFSESAASGRTTSGTFMPLRLEISPPTTTSVVGVVGRALDHLQADLAVVDEERRADLEGREDLGVRQADAVDVAVGTVEIEAEPSRPRQASRSRS